MSQTVLGCIADDFTGATDLAGILQRSGAEVSLRTGLPDAPPGDDAKAIEVIALKIRTLPAAGAVEQALVALRWLREAGAERFFWKYCSTFDSTSQGNIGPVAEALMAELGTKQTIYCPAFPENGRSVFMGHLFVGEQPLDESPMKDHPLTPMRDSSLVRLLRPQVKGDVGLLNRHVIEQGPGCMKQALAAMAEEGKTSIIVDAVSKTDLQTIAKTVKTTALLTGGSAVAETFPMLMKEMGFDIPLSEKALLPQADGGSIVLSGSCSAMTRKQVAHYAGSSASLKVDPLELSESGVGSILEWLENQPLDQPVMIYATAKPGEVAKAQEQLGTERAGQLVENALAQTAEKARDLGRTRIVTAGGETSGAVTQALDIKQMIVGKEIAAGVPWTSCKSAGKPLALALKSGNFGTETFFSDALAMLDSR